MRVLMIADFPIELDRPRGGVESVACNMAFGLIEQGIELSVIRFGAELDALRAGAQAKPPFEIIDVPRRRPGSIGLWLISPFDIRRIVDRIRPDVVHLQGMSELYHELHPPAVLTIHGIPHRDAMFGGDFLRRTLQPIVARASFEYALRRHRHVIAINPYIKEQLGLRPALELHEIANPVEDAFFEVVRNPEPMRILYVGVLSRRKNIIGLIESVAMARETFPSLRLRLGGPWHQDCESEVLEAIRRLDMESSVDLLGPLSRAEIIHELEQCTCLVLASFQETAPMVIAESMAAGVPVVASLAGGVGAMLEHGVTGMTSPVGDARAFAINLVALLSDPASQARLGREARRVAEDRHRLRRVVERTREVYERALRGD